MLFETARITDHVFADDAVIFVDTTKVLSETLQSQSEERELLGLRITWKEIKTQAFVDILEANIESIPVGSKNVKVPETITYLGGVIHS